MLVSLAVGGLHSTGVALSPAQSSHLASHRRAHCGSRSGVAVIVCSAERPPIKLIATDVDGTLLNSKQELTPAVEQAIKKAADLGVPVIFCFSINAYCRRGALQTLLHMDVDDTKLPSITLVLMQLVVATGKAPGCAWTGIATPVVPSHNLLAGGYCPAEHHCGNMRIHNHSAQQTN